MAYTTDPVADLLTRIRNANRANHDALEISSSKLKVEVCRILAAEGFIKVSTLSSRFRRTKSRSRSSTAPSARRSLPI